MKRWMCPFFAAMAALAGAVRLHAADDEVDKPYVPTGTEQSSRLYTQPDSSAGGGIKGTVTRPDQKMTLVFALAADDPAKCYRGAVSADGRSFAFGGLPVGKYDVVLMFSDEYYEGLTLVRGGNTLTKKDVESISAMANKSTPFFDTKKMHRIEGAAGREGKASALFEEVRTRPVTLQSAAVRNDIQIRSIKKAFFEDVGEVGWQMVLTREIVRQEVGGNMPKGILSAHFVPALKGIRVIDSVKDLGPLDLKRP